MLNIQQIRDIVFQIFSEKGYQKNNVAIKFPEPLEINIEQINDDISIDFKKTLPYISWQKFVRLSAYVNGFTLGKDSGVIKLKYLPDIKFLYEQTEEFINIFKPNFGSIDFSDIENEINLSFKDKARKKLAMQCLHYGAEWARIANSNIDIKNANTSEKQKLKKECSSFIKQNIENEAKYGSVVLSFILIYVLLPVVLKFIVERIFRKLFE